MCLLAILNLFINIKVFDGQPNLNEDYLSFSGLKESERMIFNKKGGYHFELFQEVVPSQDKNLKPSPMKLPKL